MTTLLSALALALAVQQPDSSVGARIDAVQAAAGAARQAQDFPGYRRRVEQLLAVTRGYPSVVYGMAGAAARVRDSAGVEQYLARYAAQGLTRNVVADSAVFGPWLSRPWFAVVRERLDANARDFGRADSAYVLPDSDFVPEGIAWDGRRHRFYVAGIRKRRIDVMDDRGIRPLTLPDSITWSVLGLAYDSTRDALWATNEGLPHAEGIAQKDRRRAGLLRIDPESGRVLRFYELPHDGQWREPGEVTIAPNGDAFVSDGQLGPLYVLRNGAPALTVLVTDRDLRSPQGSVVAADRRHLIVADYVLGLARVDLQTGAVGWITVPDTASVHGIDGLTRAGPRELVGVQNGFVPERVLRIRLNAAETAVTAVEVLAASPARYHAPTHVIVRGREAFFVANTGYEVLSDSGEVKPGSRFTRPVVWKVGLGRP